MDDFRIIKNKPKPEPANQNKPTEIPPVIPQPEDMAKPLIKETKVSMPKTKKRFLKILPNPKYYIARFKSANIKKKILMIFVLVILLAGVGAGVYLGIIKKTGSNNGESINQNSAGESAKPIMAASPLTGVEVPIGSTKRPVTAIMIENSPDARPQSGLDSAGIVFEAIAEGGITRFVGLYQDAQPNYIGPVRSLRPYYIDFAKPFDASIVHVGGSPDALRQIRAAGMKDLDQFFNGGYFTRITQRYAPHNVYTSFSKLDQLNKSKGYTSSTFTSWDRKAEEPTSSPSAKTINFSISGPLYNVKYKYDATSNSYARSVGGVAHTTIKSASAKPKQLKPKTVIALVMDFRIVDSSGHSGYTTTGSGTAYFFQDGGVTVGTWSKTSRNSQFKFLDGGDKPVSLNAGQSWVTIVKDESDVSYTQK